MNKWTCLHFAGAYGGTRIAKFLLMAGADKFAMSTNYKSAADVALDAGKERVHAFISKYLEKTEPQKVWHLARSSRTLPAPLASCSPPLAPRLSWSPTLTT